VADNNTLLHEMLHQCLFERSERAGHDSEGWRREIMRLHLEITGRPIWAGRSRVIRENGKAVRRNAPSPTGEPSLTQMQIARWPHDTGLINFGQLGQHVAACCSPPLSPAGPASGTGLEAGHLGHSQGVCPACPAPHGPACPECPAFVPLMSRSVHLTQNILVLLLLSRKTALPPSRRPRARSSDAGGRGRSVRFGHLQPYNGVSFGHRA
jgi:hypothetical protein